MTQVGDFPEGVPGNIGGRHFVGHVERAAAAVGAFVTWHCDHWVAEISRGAARELLIGYTFPLNDAAASQIAWDKVAASAVLESAKVACVGHRLIRPDWAFGETVDWTPELPVVIKPNVAYGGRGVLLARTADEVAAAVAELLPRYPAIAWSPFLEIADEYRTVFLDGEPLLVFRKVRADNGEWRHNLHFGAVPELCESTVDGLVDLGRDAMSALGLRFAAVDVVTTAEGVKVLEVNSGVSLERFSRCGPEFAARAGQVYARAVEACLRG
ncbi:ATP-grasp domain-containing protein [Actinokineospora auranticolor]|uniref:Ribosomal protein S6--L-glutamate ligase n=1 Tax=Actinokineospora auranticolor TaxID=155976 RepID=A0A2S6GY84_9PSEU|nr:ATP-grasp domain-containing protein [Actinokineospora auranticolor]PPK70202.1 ribosomal protein S6--L-glutamate ligase [Actinokineospora auranticolor]